MSETPNEIGFDVVDNAGRFSAKFSENSSDYLDNESLKIDPMETPSELNIPKLERVLNNSTVDTADVSILMSQRSKNDQSLSRRLNSSAEMYRSFRDKLRNSFNKSKKYLKIEKRKIGDFFDDKNSSEHNTKVNDSQFKNFDIEEYKTHFNDRNAEKVYQTLSSKIYESTMELTDKYLSSLLSQVGEQRDIKKQLINAVHICRNTREFENSSELIEAERLLLLSNFKEAAAMKQLVRIDHLNYGKVTNPIQNRGMIVLNEFEFLLKDVAVHDVLFNYFYICVCSYKEQVFVTYAKEKTENRVVFRKCEIKFVDMEPGYEVRVEVFVLRLRKNVRNYSHESKFHLNKVRF